MTVQKQARSVLLWMLALLSQQSHRCCHREITPTQPIQTKGSIFFPVSCSSLEAFRKPHSSLVYFGTHNSFSWAGSEMRCQKHYPRRKHIHTLCCSVCTLLVNFPNIIIGEEPLSSWGSQPCWVAIILLSFHPWWSHLQFKITENKLCRQLTKVPHNPKEDIWQKFMKNEGPVYKENNVSETDLRLNSWWNSLGDQTVIRRKDIGLGERLAEN